jgi:uncharacterized surface protein with fasciclin (FAS1) repeats
MAQPNDRAASGEVVRAVPAAFAPPPSPTREVHTMRRTLTATLAAAALAASTVLPAAAAPAPSPGPSTIAEVVVASADAGEFTLLLGALEYTGLTSVFTGGGQYTVFAPTDAAFGKLVADLQAAGLVDFTGSTNPFATIDAQLGEGTVANVLLYHVVPGRRAANSVVPPVQDRRLNTLLSGASFSVDRDGEISTIAGQSVPIAGPNAVSARNGIVHVIGEVLLPLG